MTAARRAFVVVLLLIALVVACSRPTNEATVVGQWVSDVYVRDAKTKKCIQIHWDGGRITRLVLAAEGDCQ